MRMREVCKARISGAVKNAIAVFQPAPFWRPRNRGMKCGFLWPAARQGSGFLLLTTRAADPGWSVSEMRLFQG